MRKYLYIEKYILELVMVILSPSSNREIIILELHSQETKNVLTCTFDIIDKGPSKMYFLEMVEYGKAIMIWKNFRTSGWKILRDSNGW